MVSRGRRWLPLERPDARYGCKLRSAAEMRNQLRTPMNTSEHRGVDGGVMRSNRNPLKVPASPFEAQLGAGSLHLPPSGSFQQVGGFSDAGGGFCHPGGKLAGPNRVLGGQDLAQIRDQRLRGGL